MPSPPRKKKLIWTQEWNIQILNAYVYAKYVQNLKTLRKIH